VDDFAAFRFFFVTEARADTARGFSTYSNASAIQSVIGAST
jgi:hypothetical protein